jgi:hypothetical protein
VNSIFVAYIDGNIRPLACRLPVVPFIIRGLLRIKFSDHPNIANIVAQKKGCDSNLSRPCESAVLCERKDIIFRVISDLLRNAKSFTRNSKLFSHHLDSNTSRIDTVDYNFILKTNVFNQ